MPIIITKDSVEYNLVPAPLVSFNKQSYNNIGRPGFGADFTASLQGQLIQTHGNPYYSGGTVDLSTDTWTTTPKVESSEISVVESNDRLDATIKKQEKIRSLFSNPVVSGVAQPIKVSIQGWDTGLEGSGLSFMAFVDDVSFDAEGNWAAPNSYTVNLRNATFLSSANNGEFDAYQNETKSTYNITSLSETFDVSEEGQQTLTFDNNYNFTKNNKVYTINRSISAVGSPVYDENGSYVSGLAPWQQASGYVYEYLGLGASQLPDIRSTFADLVGDGYNIANTVYNENVDPEAGSYALTEVYIAYSGVSPVIETINVDKSQDESETNSITVNGTINGLNTVDGFSSSGNAFVNAETYWDSISTGVPPEAYYYAQAILPSGGWLHPKPMSQTVARDYANGSNDYSVTFDDRPPNIIPGSVTETIAINDTYPGELFSVTPVIGRSQPILQYLNSRSEYKRSLSINITMGAQDPTWSTTLGADVNNSGTLDSSLIQSTIQSLFITQKPSITNTSEFNLIYQAANPVNDPNFTVVNGKCFHSAPTEDWDARTRSYSYNIEWTYERT